VNLTIHSTMSRVVLSSSREIAAFGAPATVMGPSRARAPSGISQTDWDNNTALRAIFENFDSFAALQTQLQGLDGAQLLLQHIHGQISNERGRLSDVLEEIGQEAGLDHHGDGGLLSANARAPSQQGDDDHLHAPAGLTVHGRRTTGRSESLQERINRGEISLLDDIDCLAEETPVTFDETPDQAAGGEQRGLGPRECSEILRTTATPALSAQETQGLMKYITRLVCEFTVKYIQPEWDRCTALAALSGGGYTARDDTAVKLQMFGRQYKTVMTTLAEAHKRIRENRQDHGRIVADLLNASKLRREAMLEKKQLDDEGGCPPMIMLEAINNISRLRNETVQLEAEEKLLISAGTRLKQTIIDLHSGYVELSISWNPGDSVTSNRDVSSRCAAAAKPPTLARSIRTLGLRWWTS
jgi:hypothetical protein